MVNAAVAARALDQRTFLPLEETYDVIASDGEGSCRAVCRQILAQTSYAFATKRFRRNEPWDLYRRVEGEDCLSPGLRQSYLEFLAACYVGLCAIRTEWDPLQDSLLVSANDNHGPAARQVVGPLYTGHVFEAYERRGGQDRLLGRWLSGYIEAPSNLYDLTARHEVHRIGKKFEPEDFYAALLGIPIRPADVTGDATPDQLLAALVPLADDTEMGEKAIHMAIQAARRSRDRGDEAAVLAWIERLLANGADVATRAGDDPENRY